MKIRKNQKILNQKKRLLKPNSRLYIYHLPSYSMQKKQITMLVVFNIFLIFLGCLIVR